MEMNYDLQIFPFVNKLWHSILYNSVLTVLHIRVFFILYEIFNDSTFSKSHSDWFYFENMESRKEDPNFSYGQLYYKQRYLYGRPGGRLD